MRIFRKEPSCWYAAGLAFECVGCGRCCAGPEEGYVWVTEREIAAIAELLGISEQQMHSRYVRRVGRRFSLVEHKGNRDCVFLQSDSQGQRKCMIYSERPTQCRTWPFWPSNLRSPQTWSAVGNRCPGINRGENLFTREEIEAKARATRE